MKAKKLLTAVFSAALTAAAMCPQTVLSANYGDDEGWSYSIKTDENGEKYISIDGYISYSFESGIFENSELIVPEKIEGIPVREFRWDFYVMPVETVSVILPATIEICDAGFLWEGKPSSRFGENLKKVDFSGNTNPMEITAYSFFRTSIEEVSLPPIKISNTYHSNASYSTIADGSEAFAECNNLKRVEFSDNEGTVNICTNMFRDCTALTEVIFPKNKQSAVIKNGSFSGCESLEKFPFETLDSNSEIGNSAFKGCAFESVTVNCGTGNWAFQDCTKLKNLTINGDISVGLSAFRNCTALENVTINGNPELTNSAFFGDSNIRNINIPELSTINGSAFNACQNLTAINGVEAFDGNTGDFVPELKDFIINNFANADDVGFMNEYVKAQVKKIVGEIITPDMNDMEKIKTIHDWICKKVKYDSEDIYNSKNHTDCSVFVGDSVVCEGYARAFNLLLNEAGIETYYVTGVNHAWNIVNLDGHYFHIDLTWDDSDENINYNYFLKSDNQIKDGNNHSSWKLSAPSSLHDFQGNTLPECSEIMGDLNSDIDVNVADLVLLNKYLLNNPDCGNLEKSLADLNFDGYTDVFDLVNMRKNILE